MYLAIAMKQLHLIGNVDSMDWMSYIREVMTTRSFSWKVGDYSITGPFQGCTTEVLLSHEQGM
jgi:hypothetical protein